MKRGTITVFLSLTLTVVLSLVGAVIESARYSALRMRTEMVMRMGLMSIFAEYNRELLNNYDLLFIDTAYGTGRPDIAATEDHLKTYIGYNSRPGKGIFSPGLNSFTAMNVESAEIPLYSYASDQGGRVFKRQAIEAVKNRFGAGIVKGVGNMVRDYKGSGVEDYNVDERRARVESELKGVDLSAGDCPVEEVYDERPGIISRLVTEGAAVSDKRLELSDLASHRRLNAGAGVVRPDSNPDSRLNDLLFDQYLKWKMSCYTNDLSHSSCSYELEYILNGKNTDQANLRDTVFKLFSIREAADTMAVFKDSGKKGQCKTLAALIALLLMSPEIVDPLTDMLLFTWGFAESVVDMRILLKGGKVPLMKDGSQFILSNIVQLVTFLAIPVSAGSGNTGLSYEDYLTILLALENRDKKVMRAMDVIEMHMRTTDGNRGFRMDGCIDYAEAEVRLKAGGGYEFEIRRDYSYEAIAA